MMLQVYGMYVFILGMIIGSFLNVVIYRLNTGRGLGGRSMCFTCRRTLSWHELFPIVSFIAQRGKCHGCRSKISMQYPIVEALTGIVFVSIFLKAISLYDGMYVQSLLFTIFYMYMFSILMVIAVYDYSHKIIPEKMVWLFNLLALVSTIFFVNGTIFVHVPNLWQLLAGPLVALPFFLLWFVTGGRGMGFGDVKLALGVGWFLGLFQGLAAIVVAFWIGGFISIFLLVFKKHIKFKSEVPFGPFLAIAVFIVFLFSVTIGKILHLS